MSFFGSSASAAPPQEMAARKEAFIQSIRGEMALANAQELMSKVGEKCFQKCVTKPGTSLSSSEEVRFTHVSTPQILF
ncbi:uncharacterized protein PHACADRAFT_193022 [Phanerochaete carnosa HHB-10118-sp]|uniref:Mitochondrial import inner membrane translocase subunit n=1 Tax=Phanerochaete carnosa (strain HHB-10118-sp) TaxID=650164 RepID=K5V5H0_PHACS|nr:uncharacterized protein PHACADRAFT_193022 [Phanerochaete carnosa HHB-10118-sp]EKM57886.1 hypothetical protein PHACADRAFT_193022 [Phanerochaete carnosa HHB-10118-sp]